VEKDRQVETGQVGFMLVILIDLDLHFGIALVVPLQPSTSCMAAKSLSNPLLTIQSHLASMIRET
jgi:hypothetical protein